MLGLLIKLPIFRLVNLVINHHIAGKRHGPERPLAFRPPKRPTAVRSPGGGTHYLKKSPSPTGIAKTPPGVNNQNF